MVTNKTRMGAGRRTRARAGAERQQRPKAQRDQSGSERAQRRSEPESKTTAPQGDMTDPAGELSLAIDSLVEVVGQRLQVALNPSTVEGIRDRRALLAVLGEQASAQSSRWKDK